MTVTIDLSPETEAGLNALAAAKGLALPQFVRQVLEEQVPDQARPAPSSAERAVAWQDVKNLPLSPPLSDEAISRDSIYGARG